MKKVNFQSLEWLQKQNGSSVNNKCKSASLVFEYINSIFFVVYLDEFTLDASILSNKYITFEKNFKTMLNDSNHKVALYIADDWGTKIALRDRDFSYLEYYIKNQVLKNELKIKFQYDDIKYDMNYKFKDIVYNEKLTFDNLKDINPKIVKIIGIDGASSDNNTNRRETLNGQSNTNTNTNNIRDSKDPKDKKDSFASNTNSNYNSTNLNKQMDEECIILDISNVRFDNLNNVQTTNKDILENGYLEIFNQLTLFMNKRTLTKSQNMGRPSNLTNISTIQEEDLENIKTLNNRSLVIDKSGFESNNRSMVTNRESINYLKEENDLLCEEIVEYENKLNYVLKELEEIKSKNEKLLTERDRLESLNINQEEKLKTKDENISIKDREILNLKNTMNNSISINQNNSNNLNTKSMKKEQDKEITVEKNKKSDFQDSINDQYQTNEGEYAEIMNNIEKIEKGVSCDIVNVEKLYKENLALKRQVDEVALDKEYSFHNQSQVEQQMQEAKSKFNEAMLKYNTIQGKYNELDIKHSRACSEHEELLKKYATLKKEFEDSRSDYENNINKINAYDILKNDYEVIKNRIEPLKLENKTLKEENNRFRDLNLQNEIEIKYQKDAFEKDKEVIKIQYENKLITLENDNLRLKLDTMASTFQSRKASNVSDFDHISNSSTPISRKSLEKQNTNSTLLTYEAISSKFEGFVETSYNNLNYLFFGINKQNKFEFNNKVYKFLDNNSELEALEVKGPRPMNLCFPALAHDPISGNLFVYGGEFLREGKIQYSNELYLYNYVKSEFQKLAFTPPNEFNCNRIGSLMCIINQYIFVFNGVNQENHIHFSDGFCMEMDSILTGQSCKVIYLSSIQKNESLEEKERKALIKFRQKDKESIYMCGLTEWHTNLVKKFSCNLNNINRIELEIYNIVGKAYFLVHYQGTIKEFSKDLFKKYMVK